MKFCAHDDVIAFFLHLDALRLDAYRASKSQVNIMARRTLLHMSPAITVAGIIGAPVLAKAPDRKLEGIV